MLNLTIDYADALRLLGVQTRADQLGIPLAQAARDFDGYAILPDGIYRLDPLADLPADSPAQPLSAQEAQALFGSGTLLHPPSTPSPLATARPGERLLSFPAPWQAQPAQRPARTQPDPDPGATSFKDFLAWAGWVDYLDGPQVIDWLLDHPDLARQLPANATQAPRAADPRTIKTLLHTVAALLQLLLNHRPRDQHGKPLAPLFSAQSSIIQAVAAQYPRRIPFGLSPRTLEKTFSAANASLREAQDD